MSYLHFLAVLNFEFILQGQLWIKLKILSSVTLEVGLLWNALVLFTFGGVYP